MLFVSRKNVLIIYSNVSIISQIIPIFIGALCSAMMHIFSFFPLSIEGKKIPGHVHREDNVYLIHMFHIVRLDLKNPPAFALFSFCLCFFTLLLWSMTFRLLNVCVCVCLWNIIVLARAVKNHIVPLRCVYLTDLIRFVFSLYAHLVIGLSFEYN